MTDCPYCGHANIDGVDECEACQKPLQFLTRPRAATLLEKRIIKDPIRTLLPREPVIVKRDTPVAEVLKVLASQRVGCVLIVEDEQVVGIFSERDALMRLNTRFAALGDRPISEFMTAQPETLELDDRICFAIHNMDLGGYRHIPVLEKGKIVGVISVRDILRYLSESILAAEPA